MKGMYCNFFWKQYGTRIPYYRNEQSRTHIQGSDIQISPGNHVWEPAKTSCKSWAKSIPRNQHIKYLAGMEVTGNQEQINK